MNFSVIITHRKEQYTIQFYENAVRCTPVISIYEWPISEFRMQWSRNEFDGFAAFFCEILPQLSPPCCVPGQSTGGIYLCQNL